MKRQMPVLGLLLAIGVGGAGACGSGTSNGGDGGPNDGGNPVGCPKSLPSAGQSCTGALHCSYGCATTAVCAGGSWSITKSNIICGGPEAGPDARREPDGAILCSSSSDCPSTLGCSPGGVISGCGICVAPMNPPCYTNKDCATIDGSAPPTSLVCGPLGTCECTPMGTGQCIPACDPKTGCGPNEACDTTSGLCGAKPCKTDGECMSNSFVDYACTGGFCAEKPCKTDADCGGHYCVSSICYPKPGFCVPPVG